MTDTANHVIRKITPVDWDSDGVPDSFEDGRAPYTVGVDDRNADSDHDGFNNASEYLAGTDPLNPDSCLRLQFGPRTTGSDLVVGWLSVTNRAYRMQSSTNRVQWEDEGNEVAGTGGELWFTNHAAAAGVGHHFYRVSAKAGE